MGNGICCIFDRSYRHFGMRDHARMIAARNVVDFRLRTRGEFLLNVGWYDFVGVAHDVPRRDRPPTDCSRSFVRRQRAAKGRYVAAKRAATSGDSADAKTAPKYFALT